jgi:hypothetical protein
LIELFAATTQSGGIPPTFVGVGATLASIMLAALGRWGWGKLMVFMKNLTKGQEEMKLLQQENKDSRRDDQAAQLKFAETLALILTQTTKTNGSVLALQHDVAMLQGTVYGADAMKKAGGSA